MTEVQSRGAHALSGSSKVAKLSVRQRAQFCAKLFDFEESRLVFHGVVPIDRILSETFATIHKRRGLLIDPAQIKL